MTAHRVKPPVLGRAISLPKPGVHGTDLRVSAAQLQIARDEDVRLEGWKAIAGYLERTVRTVQRWEREQALPLHRQWHNSLSTIYAHQSELDAWRVHRTVRGRMASEHGGPGSTSLGRFNPDHRQRRARYYWEKRTVAYMMTAVREFKTELDADPTSAAAYAGLAKTYFALSGNEFWSPTHGYPKARAAAEEALALDAGLAEAHMVIAVVDAFLSGDWSGAVGHADQALAIDGTCALAHYWRGMIAMNTGSFQDAVDSIRRAMDLLPLSAVITANVGRPLLCAGQYQQAKQWFHQALTIEPDFWIAHALLAMAHDALGEYDEAIRWLERPTSPDANDAMLKATRAQVHAHAGATSVARDLLNELLTDAQRDYVSPVRLAQVYAALGEHDQAFAWLERSKADGSLRSNTYLPYDYAFSNLRADPRFEAFVRDYLGG